MTYAAHCKERLDLYREQTLGIRERGVFLHRGKRHMMGHILPLNRYRENILPSIRSAFWKHFESQPLRLHRYFHHLNSSQALCFNLFFPLLYELNITDAVINHIGIIDNAAAGAQFEFVPDAAEGTNVDFLLPLQSGGRVLFEIKYTEADFGKAANDVKHLDKFEKIYRPRFDDRFVSSAVTPNHFFAHYQIMRNVLHLRFDKGDHLIFLVPRSNRSLGRFLPSIQSCLNARASTSVHIVFLEDLVDLLQRFGNAATGTSLAEFRAKYL